jgi:alkanesulfonate monooxygenase SsuD/methylene tetrahydromethanopterin reductase-like flavin-dependent oxidoreductase (luciferase family)
MAGMDVGIGLPATIAGVTGERVIAWARRAEERGFSSLATIDRLVYGNYEPLVTLAAAAAVTGRIRLATTVLLAPLRANGALLAKQAASVDALSNGRLTFGVAVGGREDDYEAGGVDFHHRGRAFDAMLEEWERIWGGDEIGPKPPNGRPRLIVGGAADVVFERAARHGDGWIMGGGAPDQFRQGKAKIDAAWAKAGREGSPRTMSLAYFALGDGARQAADGYLHDYYAFLGEEIAGMIAGGAATDADTVKQYVAGFADAGCDELVFIPCSPELAQVDLLADAL